MLMQHFQVQITKIIMKSLIWTTLLSSWFIRYSIFQSFFLFLVSRELDQKDPFHQRKVPLTVSHCKLRYNGCWPYDSFKKQTFCFPFSLVPKHSQRSRVHLLWCLDELIHASHPLPALFLMLPASLHHFLLLALNDKSYLNQPKLQYCT